MPGVSSPGQEPARGHRCGWPQGSQYGRRPRALYRAIMRSTYILVGLDTYVSDAVSSTCPTWTSPRGGRDECPSSGWANTAPFIVLSSHRVYGVGGPHKTTTLITVSVLLMPRLLNQQVDLSWTSDICDRAGNVGDVKVTDEDGFSLLQHDDQSHEHHHEGGIMDQSHGRSIVFQPCIQTGQGTSIPTGVL